MKKIFLFGFVILCTAVLSYAKPSKNSRHSAVPTPVTTLIIDAHVTVILVSDQWAVLGIIGNEQFKQSIMFKRSADTLSIVSKKQRDFKDAGVIYVPASQLRKIRINSTAHVRTIDPLHLPKLDVIVDGACKLAISNIGQLNIIETERYSFDYTREEYPVPFGVIKKSN